MCALNDSPPRLATSSITVVRDKNYDRLLRVRTRSEGLVSTPLVSELNLGEMFRNITGR
jgi:hypothetical protein